MKPTLFYTRHLGDMLNVLDRPISKRNVFLLIASTTGLIAHTGHRGLYKIKKKKNCIGGDHRHGETFKYGDKP